MNLQTNKGVIKMLNEDSAVFSVAAYPVNQHSHEQHHGSLSPVWNRTSNNIIQSSITNVYHLSQFLTKVAAMKSGLYLLTRSKQSILQCLFFFLMTGSVMNKHNLVQH